MVKTLGLIAVALLVAGVVIYAALRPPIGWPVEARRVVHPAGFSVVVPDGWEAHNTERRNERTANALRLVPIKAVGTPGFFTITQIPYSPTEADLIKRGYASTTYAGKPAWAKESEQKDTREHTRNVMFERNGAWFEIIIRRPFSEFLDSGIWLAYAETFKIEPAKPTTAPVMLLPATLPANLP